MGNATRDFPIFNRAMIGKWMRKTDDFWGKTLIVFDIVFFYQNQGTFTKKFAKNLEKFSFSFQWKNFY
jgi:hypothetical protein